MLILAPFFTIASFLFSVLTYLLAPILVLFADTNGNLPSYLRYFQTFDATLDAGWRDGFWEPTNLWWDRTRWLWRNPGYTFDYQVLGIAWFDSEWEVVFESDTCWLAWNRQMWAFNFVVHSSYLQIKLGWKAWNHYNHSTKQFEGGSWSAYSRIPFVATIMHGVRS